MPAPRKPAAPTVPPAGITAHLVQFAAELRAEGIASGTAELLDAVAVLEQVAWTDPADFREALAATLAKSQEDRRVFELVFDRFFFRATETAAIAEGVTEGAAGGVEGGEGADVDLEDLRRQIARALGEGSESAMRDLARLAIAAFGRGGQGSGVIGVDVQRIRRALGLRSEPQHELPAGDPRREGVPREALRRFEVLLRRELERGQIERTRQLPPSRALSELDRALPAGPLQDLAAVHRVVAQLKRRLKTQGQEARGHRRHAHVDVRRTMRASLQTGGVPVQLRYKPLRPRRPEIYVLCDVSTSVTSASRRSPTSLTASATFARSLRRSAGMRASPTSAATPTTAACGRSSACSSRTTCTRARRSSCSATPARTGATRARTSSPRSPQRPGARSG